MQSTAPAGSAAGSPYMSLILMVVLFGFMWLMIVRPQRKKEKETEAMRNALSLGDEIVTIGGFYGKVVKIKEDRLVIQCGADRTRLEIAKWAVSAVVNKANAEVKAAVDETDEQASKPTPKSIKRLGKSSENDAEEATAEEK